MILFGAFCHDNLRTVCSDVKPPLDSFIESEACSDSQTASTSPARMHHGRQSAVVLQYCILSLEVQGAWWICTIFCGFVGSN
jgi:hypothetical protein